MPQWYEQELWLRLDGALEEAFTNPRNAYSIAFDVWIDCRVFDSVFYDVRNAASKLMSELMESLAASD